MTHRILAIADAHIADQECDEYHALDCILRRLKDEPADALCVLGDHINGGHPTQFFWALSAWLPVTCYRPLPWRILSVAGNHCVSQSDLGTVESPAARVCYDVYHSLLTGEYSTTWPQAVDLGDDLRLIGLDTTAGAEGQMVSRGCIGDEQLGELKGALDTGRDCIVYAHHHLWQREPWLALADVGDLLDVCGEAGNVVAMLCGHRHKEEIRHDLPGCGVAVSLSKTTETGRVLDLTYDDGDVDIDWIEVEI